MMLSYRPGENKVEGCGDNGYRNLSPPHSNISDKTWHESLMESLKLSIFELGNLMLDCFKLPGGGGWGASLDPLR